MENTKQKLKNWFERLFKKRYIDLALLHQAKERGTTPFFIFKKNEKDNS